MRKLALPDEILLSIDKPERYIGNEVNMVRKNPDDVDIRFAMCFPDVYEIGMSHLGIQILYDMFNRRDDVYCERVYSPWLDLDKVMREKDIPLFAIESQDNIRDFDFLGITLQYEMCYANVLQVLDLSKIPLIASERSDSDPIVIGGGPCTYNPEPLADFFDIFYIGEGEKQYYRLFDIYKEHKKKGGSRQEFLEKAAEIPGMYVPAFYDVEYNEDGTIKSFVPNNSHAQKKIVKQLVVDMQSTDPEAEYNYYPRKPLVPFIKATQDRVVLEIQRGCIRGCRFCQAGMVYRPVRERNVEHLKNMASEMLKSTGHEEISLSSLSSSDYSHLEEIINYLIDEFGKKGVNISLPSLRIDAFSLDIMSKVQDVRKSSLTFAPEAGSQRLRNVINKGLTEEVILNGASLAFKGGWNRVKLYFMLGIPTETEEDMKGIAELCEKVAEVYYEIPKTERNGKVQITASSSFFIPKPFTPFQWAPMCTKEQFLERAKIVNGRMKEMLNKKSIRYNWHEADVSVIEGLLARGDRKVAKTVLRAYELGCLYDAWSDSYDNEKWQQAIKDTEIDMDFYITRERSTDEFLPWDFIDIGVTKK
ncbi:MAG: TIGR03960 family B12-binding radical SAM protein, partial [Lachnospiraceae bacterium]|nr:TIGR03960 family B12-binding radical SAM protein [Lachnospiraceae bacterium]